MPTGSHIRCRRVLLTLHNRVVLPRSSLPIPTYHAIPLRISLSRSCAVSERMLQLDRMLSRAEAARAFKLAEVQPSSVANLAFAEVARRAIRH